MPPLPRVQMLTVTQVAALLGVSKMSIYRRIQEEALPAYMIGNAYRVRVDDFERYVQASKVGAE